MNWHTATFSVYVEAPFIVTDIEGLEASVYNSGTENPNIRKKLESAREMAQKNIKLYDQLKNKTFNRGRMDEHQYYVITDKGTFLTTKSLVEIGKFGDKYAAQDVIVGQLCDFCRQLDEKIKDWLASPIKIN